MTALDQTDRRNYTLMCAPISEFSSNTSTMAIPLLIAPRLESVYCNFARVDTDLFLIDLSGIYPSTRTERPCRIAISSHFPQGPAKKCEYHQDFLFSYACAICSDLPSNISITVHMQNRICFYLSAVLQISKKKLMNQSIQKLREKV